MSQIKKLRKRDDYKTHIDRIVKPACVSEKEYERLKQIEEKYERAKQSLAGSGYNLIKLDNGLWIDGIRVNNLLDCKIDSSVDNLTEVSLKFIAKVDGLDNIVCESNYSFDEE